MSFRIVMDPTTEPDRLTCDVCDRIPFSKSSVPLIVCELPCETHNMQAALCLAHFQDIENLADFLEPL